MLLLLVLLLPLVVVLLLLYSPPVPRLEKKEARRTSDEEKRRSGETRRVLIFGRTGAGKSTLANMLVTGGLTESCFASGNSMAGVSNHCETKSGRGFEVTDTVGLGEETESARKHAKDLIIQFLRETKNTYHHILFAKEASRMDTLDTLMWKTFLEIFQEDKSESENQQQDIYRVMVVVLTKCNNPDKWLRENRTELETNYREVMGRFIAVNFPPIDDDEVLEDRYSKKRKTHLKSFIDAIDYYHAQNRECSEFRPRYCRMDDAELETFADKLWKFLIQAATAGGITAFFLLKTVLNIRTASGICREVAALHTQLFA